MIGLFASGATASLVAKNGTKKLSQLQGSNLELKLTTSKSIKGTYYETTLSRFGLAGLPMAAILDF